MKRVHVQNGHYYVHLTVNSGQALLQDSEDTETLSAFVGAAISERGARCHAFCWLPTEGHLIIQSGRTRIGTIVHDFSQPYSAYVHRKRGARGSLFRRYRAVWLEDDHYFLLGVRYVHSACIHGQAGSEGRRRCACCSDAAYRGTVKIPWITTASARALGLRLYGREQGAYECWKEKPLRRENDLEFKTEKLCLPAAAREHFVDYARKAQSDPTTTIRAITERVCRRLSTTEAHLQSPLRDRLGTKARGLVAYHARQHGISVSEVARYFGRHPSSVQAAMDTYATKAKELFQERL
jgi:hypothetical protein